MMWGGGVVCMRVRACVNGPGNSTRNPTDSIVRSVFVRKYAIHKLNAIFRVVLCSHCQARRMNPCEHCFDTIRLSIYTAYSIERRERERKKNWNWDFNKRHTHIYVIHKQQINKKKNARSPRGKNSVFFSLAKNLNNICRVRSCYEVCSMVE